MNRHEQCGCLERRVRHAPGARQPVVLTALALIMNTTGEQEIVLVRLVAHATQRRAVLCLAVTRRAVPCLVAPRRAACVARIAVRATSFG